MPSPFGRRSSRVPKEIAILLIGSDVDGRVFSEETKTVVLSHHGAGILSHYKLAPEQEVVIRRLDTQKEAELRVVGQIGAQGDVYTYGMAFLNPQMDLWGIEFPPMTEADKLAEEGLLECTGCAARERFAAGDMEADVYAVNEGLVHHCQRCGSSTLWRRASGVPGPPLVSAPLPTRSEGVPALLLAEAASSAPPMTSVAAPAPRSVASPRAPTRVENRKHHRTKVSWRACIRRPGHDDELVVCEDVSRGGFRFKCRQPYQPDSLIEVAVPYKPGEAPIFVPARIVHVQELPNHKGFRCGAAYVKGSAQFV